MALVIRQGRAHNALEINPTIGPEGAILGGHRSVDQILRNVRVVYIGAPAIFGIVDLIEQLIVAIIDTRGLELRMVGDAAELRKLGLIIGIGDAKGPREYTEENGEDDSHRHKQT